MLLKSILIKSILKNRQPFIKTIKNYRPVISVKTFSTLPEPELEPQPLNILRTVSDELIKFSENNHAYKILRTLPGYKSTLCASKLITDINMQEKEFDELLSRNWRLESATEILNGFKSACNYSKKNGIDLSDTRFDKLVDGLMDKCQDLTDDELAEILTVVRQYPPPLLLTSHNFHDIWSALDDMCCRRHHKWNIERLLLIADHWYLLGLFKYTDYMQDCIERITRKVRHLTASQLVHTLFLINITRRRIKMFEYECQLEKHIHNLTLDELGIVSMSFFKTKTPIKGTFLIGQMISKLLEETSTVKEITLSAMLKIMRVSQHLPLVDALQVLLTKLLPQVDRMSTICCIHLALLGTNAQFLHSEILTKISQKIIDNVTAVRIKDLERITFALTLVNFTPPLPANIFQEIRKECHNPDRQKEISKFPRCLACCVHYLGLAGIYDYELINRVLAPEFIQHAYGPDPFNIGREILFLDTSLRIDCPDYKGHSLDSKTVSKLTKWTVERKPDRSTKLYTGEKLMLDVKEIIENTIGKDCVFTDLILPHFHRYDHIICKDKNGAPVKLNHLEANPLGDIRKAEKDGNTWYAVIPASWNSYVRDSINPTGILAKKLHQLEKIGYTPIMIAWHEFSHLSRPEKEEFIRNKLDL